MARGYVWYSDDECRFYLSLHCNGYVGAKWVSTEVLGITDLSIPDVVKTTIEHMTRHMEDDGDDVYQPVPPVTLTMLLVDSLEQFQEKVSELEKEYG